MLVLSYHYAKTVCIIITTIIKKNVIFLIRQSYLMLGTCKLGQVKSQRVWDDRLVWRNCQDFSNNLGSRTHIWITNIIILLCNIFFAVDAIDVVVVLTIFTQDIFKTIHQWSLFVFRLMYNVYVRYRADLCDYRHDHIIISNVSIFAWNIISQSRQWGKIKYVYV